MFERNFECSKFVIYIRSKYIFVQYSKLWNPDISIFFIYWEIHIPTLSHICIYILLENKDTFLFKFFEKSKFFQKVSLPEFEDVSCHYQFLETQEALQGLLRHTLYSDRSFLFFHKVFSLSFSLSFSPSHTLSLSLFSPSLSPLSHSLFLSLSPIFTKRAQN